MERPKFEMIGRRNVMWSRGLTIVCLVFLGSRLVETLAAQELPGTKPLTLSAPLDEVMVDGIDRFAMRELAASPGRREKYWRRDYITPQAYQQSVTGNRDTFRTIIGAVDSRPEPQGIELIANTTDAALVAENDSYRIYAVRWPALKGVYGEGLMLQPRGDIKARVIALPDADWTPEMFVGLAEGVDPKSRSPLTLVASGCQVVIPTLISRAETFSGNPDIRMTNQPHREWIYRQAFEMGRHVIGYEVQKILAAVDQFERLNKIEKNELPIGVLGVGEGGLLALHSAAVDPRIDASLVSGYFQTRERVWAEPIYRNVWAQLTQFGDAELASLIAPRSLTIEAAWVPEVAGPPEPTKGRSGGAAPGSIEICSVAQVRKEVDRAGEHYQKLNAADNFFFTVSREGDGPSGSQEALSSFLSGLAIESSPKPVDALKDQRQIFDAQRRQQRQVEQLVEFTQRLVRGSAAVRDKFWSKADRSSVEKWEKTAEFYRQYIWEEMIGKIPSPTMPLNPRTRLIMDEPGYRGYEVALDVYPDVIAGGILLLPKDIKAGEKRPVVVCQHGLEGVPMDTITREGRGFEYYSAYAHELANRGFITYAPQNPYRGLDRFRVLQRKSNPLKRSLFSYILRQHERTLDFLSSLPEVDAERIGFYGLSYGGKTAVRVPPLLPRYALSICSADYDEWIIKNTSVTDRYSYMFTLEYEMFEWNMGHVANYAELASLMAPRPFMVERGHYDGVAPDEWVAWEYAKVRRHYAELGIPEKTEIEFFKGPHSINGVGTYEFLHRHLNWPRH